MPLTGDAAWCPRHRSLISCHGHRRRSWGCLEWSPILREEILQKSRGQCICINTILSMRFSRAKDFQLSDIVLCCCLWLTWNLCTVFFQETVNAVFENLIQLDVRINHFTLLLFSATWIVVYSSYQENLAPNRNDKSQISTIRRLQSRCQPFVICSGEGLMLKISTM